MYRIYNFHKVKIVAIFRKCVNNLLLIQVINKCIKIQFQHSFPIPLPIISQSHCNLYSSFQSLNASQYLLYPLEIDGNKLKLWDKEIAIHQKHN